MQRILLILILLLIACRCPLFAVDEAQERRIRSGLRLFGALLAADEDIEKKVDKHGNLVLLVMYTADQKLAETFAEELSQLGRGDKKGTIRKIPIDVHIGNTPMPDSLLHHTPAGIFLVESLSEQDLNPLIKYGIENHIIVYSPIEGDVDRGVLGGLAIETRVRPYINLQTMRASQIRIKAFFLKVAKHYDP